VDGTLATILVAVLGFVTVAGVGLALAGPGAGQGRSVKRAQTVVGREPRDSTGVRRKNAANSQDQRRRQILKTLKDQDKQQKRALLSISAKLQQAGLNHSVRQFWIVSAVLGALVFAATLLLGQSPLIGLGLAFAAAFGLPRWVVSALAARRMKKFTESFSDAMDIITRGIRSGLPVHDSLRVIGAEAPEPLAGEFRRLVESLGMGGSIEQSLDRMYESMPTPEVRFFAIVLAIQQKTGGNLAEALGNLSSVIRARKLMREKIKALSGEAVASAFIIGALPPGVVILISAIAPDYMRPLFTDPRGHVMLLVGAFWMSLGVFAMRKMINFRI
jgi:tight adherence protein B